MQICSYDLYLHISHTITHPQIYLQCRHKYLFMLIMYKKVLQLAVKASPSTRRLHILHLHAQKLSNHQGPTGVSACV